MYFTKLNSLLYSYRRHSNAKMNAVQLGFPSYQSQPFAFPYGNCEQSAWAPPLKSSRTPFPRINLNSTYSPPSSVQSQGIPPPHFPPSFAPPQNCSPETYPRMGLSSSVQQFFHKFEQNKNLVHQLDTRSESSYKTPNETESDTDGSDEDAKTFKDKYLESQIEINRLRSIIRNMESKKPIPSKALAEDDVKSLSWATITELEEHNLIV